MTSVTNELRQPIAIALAFLISSAAVMAASCGKVGSASGSVLSSGAKAAEPAKAEEAAKPATVVSEVPTRSATEVAAQEKAVPQTNKPQPKSAQGDASTHTGPLPVLYLRPAAAVEADRDETESAAQAYKLEKESESSPEQKLWFASEVVDMIYDESDESSWSDARIEAVTMAYLDCLGKYSTWMSETVSVSLENKVATSAEMPPLAREAFADALLDKKANPTRWSAGTMKSTAQSMANNYVGGLVVNKIIWGKGCVSVICVVSEASRALQAYCRGAIQKDKLPSLQPVSSVAEMIREKKDLLPQLTGGVFFWIDEAGKPFLYAVGGVVDEDLGTEATECEMLCKQQFALFMGAQVAKGSTVERILETAKSSTAIAEDGSEVKQAVAKRRKQVTQELKAAAKIQFGGMREVYASTTRLDDSRIKCVVWRWSPSEQELAELRKADQEELKKYGGRNPTGTPEKAGNTPSGAGGNSGGPAPLPGKKKPAPNGKGDSGRGVD